MSWQTVRRNYRIEVTPAGADDEHDARILLDIVQAAVRVQYQGGSVALRYEQFEACTFCGAPRHGSVLGASDCEQPGDMQGLPVCCDQAQAEFRAEQPPATVEFSDGTVTLTDWHLTELDHDYYGVSHMQIGGWLPEGYEPGSIALGTNCMVRAVLPGASVSAHDVNVEVSVKGYGQPQRFMKIRWRHAYDAARDARCQGGAA